MTGKRSAFALAAMIAAATLFADGSAALKVGVYDDPPLVYVENGAVKGIFPDLFTTISAELGVEFRYVGGDWDDLYGMLKRGEIDMLLNIARTKERENVFDFNAETIMSDWGVVYARRGLGISTILDLDKKRVAVVGSDVYFEGHPDSFKETTEGFGLACAWVETGGFSEAAKAVERGDADACVIDRVFADATAGRFDIVPTTIVFKPVRLHVGFPKGSPVARELASRIDAILDRMKSDSGSEYYKTLDRYFVHYQIMRELPVWTWQLAIGCVAGAAIVLALAYGVSLRRQVRKRTRALVAANERLRELSTTDALTGLANRRAFEDRLEQEMARAARYGENLSLLMIDIDHFKRVNDTYGHLAGDRGLVALAAALAANTRAVDLAARYGGEELVVVLPRTGLGEACVVGEKIRAAVASMIIDEAIPELKITVTVGVAARDPLHSKGSDLVLAADQALYAGKAAGRNKVASVGH